MFQSLLWWKCLFLNPISPEMKTHLPLIFHTLNIYITFWSSTKPDVSGFFIFWENQTQMWSQRLNCALTHLTLSKIKKGLLVFSTNKPPILLIIHTSNIYIILPIRGKSEVCGFITFRDNQSQMWSQRLKCALACFTLFWWKFL